MIKNKSYDHVFLVTNDLNTDRRMHRICNTLSEDGKSVLLVGRKHNKSVELIDRSFDQDRVICWINSGALFYLEINLRLFLKIKKNALVTITSNDLDTVIAGLLIKYVKKCLFYIDSHEYFSEVPELKNSPIKKWLWRCVGAIGFKRSDVNYTVNKYLALELKNQYQQDFDVIRNVPPKKVKLRNKEQGRIITLVYLGVLNEGRGLLEIIEAIQYLPNCFLKVIGDGILKKQMRIRAQELKVVDRIIFLGTLSEAEFETHIRASDIGLNLLTAESLSYYYSSANKFFDYLHLGIPVLTMSFPFYEDIARQHNVAQLIEDIKPSTIVAGIEEFKASFEYDTFNNRLEVLLEAYNWEKESKKLLNIYRFTT